MVEPVPKITKREKEEIRERTRPRAVVLHEAILQEGVDELGRATSALAWSGLAAGLSMGFSLVTEGLLKARLPDVPWAILVTKLGYTVGFLIVVLGRQQLFTENTVTVILPLLRQRDLATFLQVVRIWSVVLAANLAGAFAFAWTIANTGVFEPEIHVAFRHIGAQAMATGEFFDTFLRAIFAGWLIALMVWLLPAAETSRVSVIILIIYVVAIGNFAHIIAGSVEVLYSVVTGGTSWRSYLAGYMIPTLLGNIVGGVSLVAALNHAQVVAGEYRKAIP